MEKVLNKLVELQDLKYKDFHSKIIGQPVEIIGCRIPDLKRLAKELANTELGYDFIKALPHKYYDENALHGLILGYLKDDYEKIEKYLIQFLPYIDNWGVCDITIANLKILGKNLEKAYNFAKNCIKSGKCWKIRFGVVVMLCYLIKSDFCYECCNIVCDINNDDYYVKMAVAWFFSVVAVYDFKYVKLILENKKLNTWTHNKTIQKICESYRITEEQKEVVKKLKIK